ncbi:MAG: carboxypeptidase regulatory-like domain-containing protein, partial [bacterium]|nr:carboxypeptidase regulatory-like domain-containing protein [bacterium]
MKEIFTDPSFSISKKGHGKQFRQVTLWLFILFTLLNTVGLFAAESLAEGDLKITGISLTVEPANQTVPISTPTTVKTHFTVEKTQMLKGMVVKAELRGPGLNPLTLTTLPNHTFSIPALSRRGAYYLDSIRLERDGVRLMSATPDVAIIKVMDIVITSVTATPLKLDEIKARGIVITEENFKVYNFSVGIMVESTPVKYDFPVVYSNGDPYIPKISGGSRGGNRGGGGGRGSVKNQTIPFNFKIPTKQNVGGSISTNEEEKLMGLLVFNNDIAFLNQFFSVMFIVANSADSNSGLVLKDLTATLKLPDGLREAETNPPHIMGTGIPVKCPGDDGKLGTADDENFIVGMASGMAEFLAEGKETGNHIVTVDFEGTLSGDNFDTDVPVKGSASGVVVVRNPTYSITFSHPEIIRMGEEYDIYVTMTNTSTVPANMVSLNMNNLIGCRFENKNPEDQPGLRKFDQIAPGQSETAKYRMVSEKTGKVCATAFEADENIAGEIRLTAGVGELNIPLSPDTLILPTHAYKLADIDEEFSEIDPLDRLLNAAMISLGEAYSIAVTPPGGLPEHLPVVDREAVKTRIIELAEAGQRLGFKDTASNTLMVLALDWLGNDYPDLPFDILRRSTTKDAKLSAALARMFNMELNADPKAFQEKFATTCSYKEPFISSILSFNGGPRTARVTLTDYYGNNMTTGDEPLREIPYGQVYGMEDTGQNPVDFALIGSLQQDENDVVNYSQTFEVTGLETGTFDLSLSLPDKNNTLWQVSFSNIQCYKGSRSIITVTSEITQSIITASPGTDKFVLSTDTNGDGTLDSHQDGELVKMEPLALQMISATQDCAADSAGHVAALFFNRPVSRVTAENSDNYFVKNKHIYASFLQPSRRVILVGMDNPISPFVESRIKVENLEDETGSPLAAVEMKIEPTIEVPGGVLFGRVLTANGDPVSGARLMLEEIEEIGEREKTSRSYCVTDIGGNYTFDFVRILRTPFRLTVVDENGKTEEISDRIKYLGEWRQMDIFMRGHGSIKGTVFKSDSTVAPGARVRAYPENASDGVLFLAECDSDGVFSFTGLPVGRVHLHAYFGHEKADDSVDIPEAGALANTEITLAAVQYGHVQGTIEEADGTPIQGVQVLIYRNNRPMNFIETPDENGNFKFENVSVGKFTVKSYHPETGQHIEESREVFAGATTEVRLSFNGYGSVSGTVRDHDNQDLPAVGADVFIPGINLYTKADANGEFRFTRVPLDTRFSIKARHQGSGRETSEEFQVNYGNETSVLLYLPVQGKTGSIEGQIFDEKGSPLVLVNGEAVDIYIIDKSNRRIVSFAHAAADGTFKVTNIYTGTFGVVAVPDSRNSVGVSQAVSVTQTVDGLLRQVDVNLRGKGKLDINVENSDGSASIMADVTVRSDVFRFPNFTTIDSHYKSVSKQQVEIWAGKYTVSAQNGFYDRVSKPGVVADGETDTVTLNMNKLGTIQLTVLDHTGAPVSGAKVSIRAGSYHDDNIVTNANGQFLFTVVPKGGFVIEATDTVDMRFGRYGGEIKSDEPLEATLRLLGWARVKVAVMDADGTPIPASMISSIHLKNTGFPYQTLSQDAATPGEPTNIFNFSNVYQGNFIVSVATLNGLGGRGRGEIKSHGLDVDLNIYLEDWGKVTGKVVKPESGEAVANARVTLLCGDKVFGYCTTSAEGLYSFDYVPKGKVRVKAYDPFTARSGSENGSIAGQNDVEQIDVQLDGLGSVSGTFHDSDGNTVQGGKITLKGN